MAIRPNPNQISPEINHPSNNSASLDVTSAKEDTSSNKASNDPKTPFHSPPIVDRLETASLNCVKRPPSFLINAIMMANLAKFHTKSENGV